MSIGKKYAPSDLIKICSLPNELKKIYEYTDGFFAFESALHVFPLTDNNNQRESIASWNRQIEFIDTYNLEYPNEIIFAEDAIGGQFVLTSTGVSLLDLETNEREFVAPDIESWAKSILDDYEYLAAFTLAHDWQMMHGTLPVGCRLSPNIPFILGGEFLATNLKPIPRKELLRFRAHLFEQIRDIPSGSTVTLSVKP